MAGHRFAAVAIVAALLVGCAPAQGLSDATDGSEPPPSDEAASPTESPDGGRPSPEASGGAGPSTHDGRAPATAGAEQSKVALPDGDDVVVERIVDGDTLAVSGGERVRLIGVDTPESVHPSKPVECFGPEASAHLAELVPEGTSVRLVHDVERHDRYGRTLAYVWRDDGLDVNKALVEDGYAMVYTVPPNVDRQQEFLDAQRAAREDGRGLWADCAGELAVPPDFEGSAPDTAGSDGESCHESYPDVCIPPPPPDLDCGSIPHRHVRVLPPDPHNLDGDGDGLGCQS